LRPGSEAKRLLEADDAQHSGEVEPPPYSVTGRLGRYGLPALRYLLKTEVHTYAFSVAANAILSFFPFIVLLLTVTRRGFHSVDMYNIVIELVRQYLPSNQDFVVRNLQFLASVKGRGQALSFVMLLITSTGVFLPLEVALNKVWGFKRNRNYVMNGIVSLGLAMACASLALLSVAVAAQGLKHFATVLGSNTFFFLGAQFLLVKAAGIATAVGIYFLIYWLLPNGRVPVRAVLPAAIIMALLTEAAKYLYVLALRWLNFPEVYGPFAVSVTLMFWAYLSGMLLLLGAYLSAAKHSDRMQAKQQAAA
jgi:YihY family inner membrane protein